jgi:hypothetical protein
VSIGDHVDAVVYRTESSNAISDPPLETARSIKPALASIKASCEYMGGISRSKFYGDITAELEIVKLGARTFVVVASMDRFIDAQPQAARDNRRALETPDTNVPALPEHHTAKVARTTPVATDCTDSGLASRTPPLGRRLRGSRSAPVMERYSDNIIGAGAQ